MEEGTTQGLEGAVFKITAPDGSTVGSTYTTGPDGTVTVQLNQTGHFTVEELTPPKWYVKGENSTQHVNVTAGQMEELTFTNKPYGNLRVEKYSDTGEPAGGYNHPNQKSGDWGDPVRPDWAGRFHRVHPAGPRRL